MHKVEEVVRAKLNISQADDEPRIQFLRRAVVGLNALDYESWCRLTADSQDWSNAATIAMRSGETIPEFGDALPPPRLKDYPKRPDRKLRRGTRSDALTEEIRKVAKEVRELKLLFACKVAEVAALERANELRPSCSLCRTEENWRGED